jgi:hypothetical protein
MVPKLVKAVELPAVALLRNDICAAPALTTKCCTIPEKIPRIERYLSGAFFSPRRKRR